MIESFMEKLDTLKPIYGKETEVKDDDNQESDASPKFQLGRKTLSN